MESSQQIFSKVDCLIASLGVMHTIDLILASKDQTVNFFRSNISNIKLLFKDKEIFTSANFLKSEKLNEVWQLFFRKMFENFDSEKPEKKFLMTAFCAVPMKKKFCKKIVLSKEQIGILIRELYGKKLDSVSNQTFFFQFVKFFGKLKDCFTLSKEDFEYILLSNSKYKLDLITIFADFHSVDSETYALLADHLASFSYADLFEVYPLLARSYLGDPRTVVRISEIVALFEKWSSLVTNQEELGNPREKSKRKSYLFLLVKLIFEHDFSFEDKLAFLQYLRKFFDNYKRLAISRGINLSKQSKKEMVKIFYIFVKKVKKIKDSALQDKARLLEEIRGDVFSNISHIIMACYSGNYLFKKSLLLLQTIYNLTFLEILGDRLKYMLSKSEIKREVMIHFFARLPNQILDHLPETLISIFEENSMGLINKVKNKINKNLNQYLIQRINYLAKFGESSKQQIESKLMLILENDFLFEFSFDYSQLEVSNIKFEKETIERYLLLIEERFDEKAEKLNEKTKNGKRKGFKSFILFLMHYDSQLVEIYLKRIIEKQKKNEEFENSDSKRFSNNFLTLVLNLPIKIVSAITTFDFILEKFNKLAGKLTLSNFDFCNLVSKFISKLAKIQSKITLTLLIEKRLQDLKGYLENPDRKEFDDDFILSFNIASILIFNEHSHIFDAQSPILDTIIEIQTKVLQIIEENKLFNSNFCSALGLAYYPVKFRELKEAPITDGLNKLPNHKGYLDGFLLKNCKEYSIFNKLIDKKIKVTESNQLRMSTKIFTDNFKFYNRLFFYFLSKYNLFDKAYIHGLITHSNNKQTDGEILEFLSDLEKCVFNSRYNAVENIEQILITIEPICKNLKTIEYTCWKNIASFFERLLALGITFEYKEKIFGFVIWILTQKIQIFENCSDEFLEDFKIESASGIFSRVLRKIMRLYFHQMLNFETSSKTGNEIINQTNIIDNLSRMIVSIYLVFYKRHSLKVNYTHNCQIDLLENVKRNSMDESLGENLIYSVSRMQDTVLIYNGNQAIGLDPSERIFKQLLNTIAESIATKSIFGISQVMKSLNKLNQDAIFSRLLKSTTNFKILGNLLLTCSDGSLRVFIQTYKQYVNDSDEKTQLRIAIMTLLFKIVNRTVEKEILEKIFFEELSFFLTQFFVKNIEKFFLYQNLFFPLKYINPGFMHRLMDFLISKQNLNGFLLAIYLSSSSSRFLMEQNHQNVIFDRIESVNLNANQQYFVLITQSFLFDTRMSIEYLKNDELRTKIREFNESAYLKLMEIFEIGSTNVDVFLESLKKMKKYDQKNVFLIKINENWVLRIQNFLNDPGIENTYKEKLIAEFEGDLDLRVWSIFDCDKIAIEFEKIRKSDYRIAELFYLSLWTKNCFLDKKWEDYFKMIAVILSRVNISTLQKFERFNRKLSKSFGGEDTACVIGSLEKMDICSETFLLLSLYLPSVHANLKYLNRFFRLAKFYFTQPRYETEKEKLRKGLSEFCYLLNSYLNLEAYDLDYDLIRDLLKNNTLISYLA